MVKIAPLAVGPTWFWMGFWWFSAEMGCWLMLSFSVSWGVAGEGSGVRSLTLKYRTAWPLSILFSKTILLKYQVRKDWCGKSMNVYVTDGESCESRLRSKDIKRYQQISKFSDFRCIWWGAWLGPISCFCIQVPWFSMHFHCETENQVIFRHLLYCRYVERKLVEVWVDHQYTKELGLDSSFSPCSAYSCSWLVDSGYIKIAIEHGHSWFTH